MYTHCGHTLWTPITLWALFPAGIHHWGFPSDKAGLLKLGGLANATGAACVEVLGALPDAEESARRVASLFPEASSIVPAQQPSETTSETTSGTTSGKTSEPSAHSDGGGGGGGEVGEGDLPAAQESVWNDIVALSSLQSRLCGVRLRLLLLFSFPFSVYFSVIRPYIRYSKISAVACAHA